MSPLRLIRSRRSPQTSPDAHADPEQVDHEPVAIRDCLPERVHLLVAQDLLSGHRPDGILSADLGCGCDVRGSEASATAPARMLRSVRSALFLSPLSEACQSMTSLTVMERIGTSVNTGAIWTRQVD